MIMNITLTFSGHESFFCKHIWLKKGYDFVEKGKSFTDDSSVLDLGVGKNMVSSIRFWMKSFGILNEEDELSDIANYIFRENGKDPFIEYEGTIWLLHYLLIKTKKASIYDIIFNELRKERVVFSKDQLQSFLKRKCKETDSKYNSNTINKDISVFKNNYTKIEKNNVVEDDYLRLFPDLNLVKYSKSPDLDGKNVDWFKIENKRRDKLPPEIFLFTILDNEAYGNSISIRDLQLAYDSPGSIFAISTDGILDKIKQVTEIYSDITYSDTAGIQVLQFKSNLNKWDILDDYFTV